MYIIIIIITTIIIIIIIIIIITIREWMNKIRTEYIRKTIDKEDIDSQRRMCGERDETVAHVLGNCKMSTQRQYKKKWRQEEIYIIERYKQMINGIITTLNQ